MWRVLIQVYLVEKVITTFGVNGYRQQLSIPYRINLDWRFSFNKWDATKSVARTCRLSVFEPFQKTIDTRIDLRLSGLLPQNLCFKVVGQRFDTLFILQTARAQVLFGRHD